MHLWSQNEQEGSGWAMEPLFCLQHEYSCVWDPQSAMLIQPNHSQCCCSERYDNTKRPESPALKIALSWTETSRLNSLMLGQPSERHFKITFTILGNSYVTDRKLHQQRSRPTKCNFSKNNNSRAFPSMWLILGSFGCNLPRQGRF